MSDHLPSIRTRLDSFNSNFGKNAPVPEMTPDLAERLGLGKLAELKRGWGVKRPSSQEVMLAIWNDLQAKNKQLLAKGPGDARSMEELRKRLVTVLDGIQFVHGQAVSRNALNKIMWNLLEPGEHKAVGKGGEWQPRQPKNAIRVLLETFAPDKTSDETRVNPKEAEKAIKETLLADLSELAAGERAGRYKVIVASATGRSAEEIKHGEALNNYGTLRKAEAAYKKDWCDRKVALILAAIRETLGDRVADALQPQQEALAERAFDDPDPEALLESLEKRDFRICLELAVSCAKEKGLWDENTKLSDYELEGKFKQMLGDLIEKMDKETDSPKIVLQNKPKIRKRSRHKEELPENGQREAFDELKAKVDQIDVKKMSFCEVRELLEVLDKLDQDIYFNY